MTSNRLGLILETRLDVLNQAIDEVNGVINAMSDQRNRLDEVEEFLSGVGSLYRAETKVLENVRDAANRTDLILRSYGPMSAGAQQSYQFEGQEDQAAEEDRLERLREIMRCMQTAEEAIRTIGERRVEVYRSFQNIRRWSVAGLVDTPLKDAVRDYKSLILEISRSEKPWHRYEAEMPRRGHELFTRYLELLAGMAVRGFGLDENVMSDVHSLIQQLMEPVPDEEKPTGQQRSPLALMNSLGRRHVPLGYPEWSLWALPLVGRSAGELMATFLLPKEINKGVRTICADLYAEYVLGPSYLHAAIFLELDPSPEPFSPELSSDILRAELLLEKFPQLCQAQDSAHRDLINEVVEKVATEWREARNAVGGQEPVLEPEARDTIESFIGQIMENYPEVAYPADYVADNKDAGRELLGAISGEEDNERQVSPMQLRDLMSAMWLARLEEPDKARVIHERAKAIARKWPGPPPDRPGRSSPRRSGPWG